MNPDRTDKPSAPCEERSEQEPKRKANEKQGNDEFPGVTSARPAPQRLAARGHLLASRLMAWLQAGSW
jgi:hypothetical protein